MISRGVITGRFRYPASVLSQLLVEVVIFMLICPAVLIEALVVVDDHHPAGAAVVVATQDQHLQWPYPQSLSTKVSLLCQAVSDGNVSRGSIIWW